MSGTSLSKPLLETIEPDEPSVPTPSGNITSSSNGRPAVILKPTDRSAHAMATTPGDAESGIAAMFRQSTHPLALFFLFLFRISAIIVYIFCGFVTSNYVLSTVAVVVLLAMDFWNCRNVAGRTLVGLRFWNQVDEDGESYWVFESRDPSHLPNPVDSKMFWIALYSFPLLWAVLFIVCLVKLNLSFVPIVVLALIFNVTNVVGFTYADRDAKQRWANTVASSGWTMGMGGVGGQILTGAMKNTVGRWFT